MTSYSIRRLRERLSGFTLVEIALTIGIVSGTALVAIVMIGAMNANVRRLKVREAKPRIIADSNPLPTEHPLPDEMPPEGDDGAEDTKPPVDPTPATPEKEVPP